MIPYWAGDEPWTELVGDVFTSEEYMAIGKSIYISHDSQKEYMAGRVLDWAYAAHTRHILLKLLFEGKIVCLGLNEDDELMFALRKDVEEKEP